MENKNKFLENIKTMFQRINSNATVDVDSDSPKPIPLLSPLANSVLARCSKILKMSTEELQSCFDKKIADSGNQPINYARSLLEFCSYKALDVATARSDYLADKDFRRLTYDMMLAWEYPGVEGEPTNKENASSADQKPEEDEGWPLFYSSSTDMAVQVDSKRTVGSEAFARIAPACAAIADVITAQNLFDALRSSSDQGLHFLIYDKYLKSLDRVIKTAKSAYGTSSNLQLIDGEVILDVDGTIPTQPVLQHIGISAWPGRLTLTSYALYFESFGVGVDKAARYDLSMDLKQVIKPELTGPLGARLFDKAVMYRSTLLVEPVFLEFPEFKGSSRRDYWLDISLEILHANRFIKKYNLKGIQQSEAIGRAILGVFRCRAIKEAFHIFSSHYKTLLLFNLAENLPGGDSILETLSSGLSDLLVKYGTEQGNASKSPSAKEQLMTSPVSLVTLSRLGMILDKDYTEADTEALCPSGYVCFGQTDPSEIVVKQLKLDTGKAEAAQKTVNQVKVDGIDANLAVMKELLLPVIFSINKVQYLASWEEPLKSTLFLALISYMLVSGWIKFVLPCILVFFAMLMLWRTRARKGSPVEAFKITPPPNKNAVEQLITLQEAIAQVEALIQAGNIILLKIRALLLAVLPQATDRVALLLLILAAAFILLPPRFIVLAVLTEAYTREMPLRRDTSDRWLRRVREWWFRIPAAPVQLVRPDDDKKRK